LIRWLLINVTGWFRIGFLSCLLLSIGFLLSTPIYASQTVSKEYSQFVPQAMSVLVDESEQLTIDDIIESDLQRLFKPIDDPTPNFGITGDSLWFRVDLDFEQNQLEHVFYVAVALVESISFYQQKDGKWQELTMGLGFPQSQKVIYDPEFFFPIGRLEGKQTFYFKLHNHGTTQFPLILIRQDYLTEFLSQKKVALGIYYGIMLAMIIYNLFLYLSIRSRSYLFYVCYLICVTTAISFYDGMIQLTVIDNHPFAAYRGINWFTAFTCIFGVLFGRQFLRSKQNTPKLDKFLKVFIGFALIYFFAEPFLSRELSAHFISSIAMTFLILMVVLGVACVRRGIRVARFFLAAWLLMMTGSASALVMIMGEASFSLFTGYGVHIGTALEALMLSFALAYRINVLRYEKQKNALAAKRALEEKNRQLELNNTMKDQFFSVMSHELRTPINGIVGGLELIETEGLNDEQYKHYQIAQSSAQDMLHLVKNLLLYSELQFEHLKLHSDEVNISEFVQKIGVRYRGLAASERLHFDQFIDTNVPETCRFDATYLRVLLEHVLDNAFKFTQEGVIQFTVKHDGNSLIFNVIDQGPGISAELKKKIFQPFSQNDQNFNRRYGGMGIGLALCNKLANLMNGSLAIDDGEGSGTDVTVRLPCSGEHKTAEASVEQHIETREINDILVVDDNPTNLLLLKKIVMKLGFNVVTAGNGQEAIDYLGNHIVDFVFMDCQMPVLDGYEATKAIRAMSNKNHEVPIVAVTANAMSNNKELCLQAGMDGYISKPFSLKRIKQCLELWQNGEENETD